MHWRLSPSHDLRIDIYVRPLRHPRRISLSTKARQGERLLDLSGQHFDRDGMIGNAGIGEP